MCSVSPAASALTPPATPARGPWEPQGFNLRLQLPQGPRRRDLSSWKADPTVLLPGVRCRWAGGHSVQMAALGGRIVSGSAPPPPPRSSPGKWPGSNKHARLEEFGRARPQTCPQVTALHCRSRLSDSPQEAGEWGSQDDASRPLQTPAVPAHQSPTIGAWVAFLAAARGSGDGRKPPVPTSREDPA